MGMGLFFRFRGRIGRARYWIGTLAALALVLVFYVLLASLVWLLGLTINAEEIWLIGTPIILVAAYATIAMSVKRLHDRNKTGWWVLIFYVAPSVLEGFIAPGSGAIISSFFGIWALIELGFLRGTSGPNRFGPDPLAPAATITANLPVAS